MPIEVHKDDYVKKIRTLSNAIGIVEKSRRYILVYTTDDAEALANEFAAVNHSNIEWRDPEYWKTIHKRPCKLHFIPELRRKIYPSKKRKKSFLSNLNIREMQVCRGSCDNGGVCRQVEIPIGGRTAFQCECA